MIFDLSSNIQSFCFIGSKILKRDARLMRDPQGPDTCQQATK